MILLNVNSTSCAVNGCPSCHCTSLRRVNVHVSPSSECSHDSANDGSTSSVSHETSVNPSNRYPRTPDDDASLAIARLNVSGSLIVAKVSAPPAFPISYSNSSALLISCRTVASSSSFVVTGTTVAVGGTTVAVGGTTVAVAGNAVDVGASTAAPSSSSSRPHPGQHKKGNAHNKGNGPPTTYLKILACSLLPVEDFM